MSIQNFYGSAVQNDFARLFQFRVLNITMNNGAVNYQYNGGPAIYVETANLPGRAVNNIQVPFMGMQFNVPGTTSYPGSNNYPVVFRADQSYAIRDGLEKLLVNTFHIGNTAGLYNTPGQNNTLTMQLFGKSSGDSTGPRSVRTYTLYGVYLVGLADTLYDVKDTGTIATINATLAYQYWTAGGQGAAGPGMDTWGGSGASAGTAAGSTSTSVWTGANSSRTRSV
jgi:hypothetical protein